MHAEKILDAIWAVAINSQRMESFSDDPRVALIALRGARQEPADHAAAVAHIAAGVAARTAGDHAGALEEFGWAFAYTAPDPAPLIHVVSTLIATRSFAAAETWALRMIENGADTGDARLHLAHAAWGAGRHEAALAICDDMVERFPDHAGVVETMATLNNQRGDASAALTACLALLARDTPVGTIPPNLYLLSIQAAILSDRDLPPWCADLFDHAAAAADAPEQIKEAQALLNLRSDYRSAWNRILGARSESRHDRQSGDRLRTSQHGLLSKFIETAPVAKILSLHDPDALKAAYSNALACPDALEQEGFTSAGGGIALAGRSVLTADFELRAALCRSARRLQLEIVRAGVVRLLSPFGQSVTSATSIVLNYNRNRREHGSAIAYFFSEPRPMFAIFATEDFWPVAWYDPVRELILRHGLMGELDFFLQDRVKELKLVCLSDSDLTQAYFEGDSARGSRPTTLLVGILDFLSTHVFSDIQGLSRLLDAGLGGAVARILLTAPEPLGPVDSFFPELAGEMFERPGFDNLIDLNHYLWRNDTLATRVTGGMVESSTSVRLISRARRMANPDWRARIDALAASAYPLIFVSLRSHSRRWLSSPADVAGVFTALQTRHPGLAVIFDGHSATDVAVPESIAATEQEMLRKITDALPPQVTALISAGRSMEDSIYAAQACHLQLSAQGTSATKGVLIAGKPGVVIGSQQFGWDAGAFRTPPPFLITPWREAFDAVEGDIQCDYYLDPAVVVAALEEVLASIEEMKA